jgi:type I restriction-modification system DNA methylase subunit
MSSRWDDLDASKALEQTVHKELRAALDGRGFDVIHRGSATSHAPGGRADIEVRARDKSLFMLVELTKRKGASADGEFVSTTDHLQKAIDAGGYEHYGLLFAAPFVGARLRKNFLEYNRNRLDSPGRAYMLDFAGLEMIIDALSARDADVYPGSRWAQLFADDTWVRTGDDAQARQVAVETLLEERVDLLATLAEEARVENARMEQQLKQNIMKLEDKLRDRGITGDTANKTLIYLTFMRLFEEKQLQEGKAKVNRMSAIGFRKWADGENAAVREQKSNRLVNYLLELMRAEDPNLKISGLLNVGTEPIQLHEKVTDDLVKELVFKVYDDYDFIGTRLDILGVVFETLARRGEKDTRIGQFFTPEEVVNFGADIAELDPHDRVLDPAVGTARFLIAAMDRMLARAELAGGDVVGSRKSIKEKQLHGVDIDQWVATIAKMNMYIHGDGKSNVGTGNGLVIAERATLPQWGNGVHGKIDVVLTNPPLGDVDFNVAAKDWLALDPTTTATSGEFLRSLGVIPTYVKEEMDVTKLETRIEELDEQVDQIEAEPKTSTRDKKLKRLRDVRKHARARVIDLQTKIATDGGTILAQGNQLKGGALFVGAINQYLTDASASRINEPFEWRGGRAVIVLDEAILNTVNYAPTREFIRQNFFIKAIVSLGRPAFKYLAHTDAKTSILYAIKKPNTSVVQQEPIFYAHAEKVGYSATGQWIGSDLPDVLVQYGAFRQTIKSGYAGAIFQSAEVDHQITQLSGAGVGWHSQSVGGPNDRLDFYHARRIDLERQLRESGVPTTTLRELIMPRVGSAPVPSRTGEYDFAVVDRNAAMLRPKGLISTKYPASKLWMVEPGDIVVSGIDLVHGAVAVATANTAGHVMSQEMFAYSVIDREVVLPEFMVLLLRTAQTLAMVDGVVTGTSNRTRLGNASELLDVVVPSPPLIAEQEKIIDSLRQSHQAYWDTRDHLLVASEGAAAIWPVAVAVIDDEDMEDAAVVAQ